MSTRDITTANINALNASVVKPVLFARLDFSSGVQRYHTEIGPKTAVHPVHGSESYTGVGDFGGIQGEAIESVSGAPQALRLALSGVNSTLINIALTDDYFRRDAEVMIGLEDATGTLIDDPVILFSGFMDKVDIALNDKIGTFVLTCESRGQNLRRAPDNRFTDEDKQREVSGDLFGEYIYRMQDLELFWGDRAYQNPFGLRGGRRDAGPNRGGRGASDSRLKRKVKVVRRIGGLEICKWRWNARATRLYGLHGASTGVIAQQAREVNPAFVGKDANGFLTVDYPLVEQYLRECIANESRSDPRVS